MKHRILSSLLLLALLLCSACGSSNVGNTPLPGQGDTTNPVIGTVTGVSAGGNVSGSVSISAVATDNVAVTTFTLSIDGAQKTTTNTGSLSYTWDTTAETNGNHSLVFTARDAKGNTDTETISVNVNNGGGGGGGNGTVSGVVYMPNGEDPVSGALVYVRGAGVSAVGDPPDEDYEAFDYTDAAGAFELSNVPTGSQQIRMLKGAFVKTITVDVQEGNNTLGALQTTLPSASGDGSEVGKILVVTGSYDHIENVLAKLGLGDIDGTGTLVLGTEDFDLVDGNNALDDASYDNFDEFFATETNFNQYRTIFLNCGNEYESDFFADTDAVAALKAWVEGGGRLYCTDWSYDFCEQLFPTRIDFSSITAGDGFSSTPETADEAQSGASIESLDCDIEDTAMRDWLAGVGATTTASSSLVNVIDWLPGWSAIEAVDANVKVWATGNVTAGFPATTAVRPVTVSFSAGDGVVLVSSYHTEASVSADLTPQDRVMQYLIFEIL
ncbi:hypothetical protein IT575_06165 [bacterium]|nr:hypothetical protein [bacterium]